MPNTIFLAQIIGLFFGITGLSMFLRRKMMMTVFHELFRVRALSYMLGVVMLILGLFLVLQHNFWWQGTLNTVITILGWYILLESVFYLFLPQKSMRKAYNWLEDKKIYYLISGCFIILGAYLIYSGFAR